VGNSLSSPSQASLQHVTEQMRHFLENTVAVQQQWHHALQLAIPHLLPSSPGSWVFSLSLLPFPQCAEDFLCLMLLGTFILHPAQDEHTMPNDFSAARCRYQLDICKTEQLSSTPCGWSWARSTALGAASPEDQVDTFCFFFSSSHIGHLWHQLQCLYSLDSCRWQELHCLHSDNFPWLFRFFRIKQNLGLFKSFKNFLHLD
jgi:hypothetical protein